MLTETKQNIFYFCWLPRIHFSFTLTWYTNITKKKKIYIYIYKNCIRSINIKSYNFQNKLKQQLISNRTILSCFSRGLNVFCYQKLQCTIFSISIRCQFFVSGCNSNMRYIFKCHIAVQIPTYDKIITALPSTRLTSQM